MKLMILQVIAIIIVFYVIWAYNKAVRLQNYIKEAFSVTDVYLKQRRDLIPNLVESVKTYMAHEQSVLTDIAKIRSTGYSNLAERQKIDTNTVLDELLSKFTAVCENYPALNARFIVEKMPGYRNLANYPQEVK